MRNFIFIFFGFFLFGCAQVPNTSEEAKQKDVDVESFRPISPRPALSAYIVKTPQAKKCPKGGSYLGPNDVRNHWGTCVKVNRGQQIETRVTKDKFKCQASWVYVGPFDAGKHWGHCARLNNPDWKLRVSEVRASKKCRGGGVYAGANNVKSHWGHCIYIDRKQNSSPSKPFLTAYTVSTKNGKRCYNGGKYVGPIDAGKHWGTCLGISTGYHINTKSVRNKKKCTGTWAYIGMNRADRYGGHCVRISPQTRRPHWKLSAALEKKDNNCVNKGIYVGARAVNDHWGHCVSVVLDTD